MLNLHSFGLKMFVGMLNLDIISFWTHGIEQKYQSIDTFDNLRLFLVGSKILDDEDL